MKTDRLDINQFREALREVKNLKGWSWTDMADLSGVSKGRLTSMMYDKRLNTISTAWATELLKSLLNDQKEEVREYDPF